MVPQGWQSGFLPRDVRRKKLRLSQGPPAPAIDLD